MSSINIFFQVLRSHFTAMVKSINMFVLGAKKILMLEWHMSGKIPLDGD